MAIPLAPSRLAPLEIDDTGEPAEPRRPHASLDTPPAPSPLKLADGYRFLRGTLTHALLEHLPALDPAPWEAAARRFVATRGRMLGPATQQSIVAETLAVLRDTDHLRRCLDP